MPSAYLLVSHGSRDPRPQVAMERLAWLISQPQARNHTRLATVVPTPDRLQPSRKKLPITVGTAYLELNPLALHEQITAFGDRALQAGYDRIQIVPLFLLPGVHVMEDIPAEVSLAQSAMNQQLDVRPYLGSHPGLINLLTKATTEAEASILLAHGSRRAGSMQPVEAIAQQLGAMSAYWAVDPSLESRVQELVSAGKRRIAIIPYFLFAGGITDAIASAVGQLQENPDLRLLLAEPLGASQELADLILDLVD